MYRICYKVLHISAAKLSTSKLDFVNNYRRTTADVTRIIKADKCLPSVRENLCLFGFDEGGKYLVFFYPFPCEVVSVFTNIPNL